MDAAPSSGLLHPMQGLVDVANEVDDELQRFSTLVACSILVGQDFHEIIDLQDDAIIWWGAITAGIVLAAQRNTHDNAAYRTLVNTWNTGAGEPSPPLLIPGTQLSRRRQSMENRS